LILMGVRQTGKTYLLKQFGAEQFPACHYINFEHHPKANQLFAAGFDPKQILTDLSFILGQPINTNTDLVIFDEIQACPAALTSLKYFSENMAELALCSAGSLLGLHLGDTSFPVGKVDFFHLRPMCFAEFLEAVNDQASLQYLNNLHSSSTMSLVVHEHLWEQFKRYLVVGGLPEAVQTYIEHQTNLFTALQQVREKQKALIFGYYADIAKHAGKVNAMHIDRVWQSIPTQLAKAQDHTTGRFQFKGIIPGIDRYHRLANVFDWLQAAELIIRVPIISTVALPLSAYVEDSRFKCYLFDIGILGALSDLSPQTILSYDYGTYKGYFVENFIAQELTTRHSTRLYSWEENRAEVEFLLPQDNAIIPIEVKSGAITRSQSLNKYVEKYHPPTRVVFNAKPMMISNEHHYQHYPLYMAYWFSLK
jgi:predicted AAA+ superfamily ATPase